MNSANSTYNGWTNYETWRVGLEIFDNMTVEDFGDFSEDDPRYVAADLGDCMRSMAEEIVLSDAHGLARDYAAAFLSAVNWRELAASKLAEYAD